jgi:LysM repeat protein
MRRGRPVTGTARAVLMLTGTVIVAAVSSAAAPGWLQYRVDPGDSLWSLAGQRGTTVEQIMAENGLTDDALRAGDVLYLPGSRDGTAGRVEPPGSYVVQPGDSLSVLADRTGSTVNQLAARNGLAPTDELRIGELLWLTDPPTPTDPAAGGTPTTGMATTSTPTSGTAASAPAANDALEPAAVPAGQPPTTGAGLTADQPPPAGPAGVGDVPGAGTAATVGAGAGAGAGAGTLPSAAQVAEIQALIRTEAARQGVDPSLALAVASVESDFDPTAISRVGAVGVMQLMPRTATWLSGMLGRPIDRRVAADNVAGGVAFLRFLLAASDPRTAVGGYYQGLDSVLQDGFFPDTTQYVTKVLARRVTFAR